MPFVQVIGNDVVDESPPIRDIYDLTTTDQTIPETTNQTPSTTSEECLNIQSSHDNKHTLKCKKRMYLTKAARKQLPESMSDVPSHDANNLSSKCAHIPQDDVPAELQNTEMSPETAAPQNESLALTSVGRHKDGIKSNTTSKIRRKSKSVELNQVGQLTHNDDPTHPSRVADDADLFVSDALNNHDQMRLPEGMDSVPPKRQLRTRHKSASCLSICSTDAEVEHSVKADCKRGDIKEDGLTKVEEVEKLEVDAKGKPDDTHLEENRKLLKSTAPKSTPKSLPIDLTNAYFYMDSDIEIIGSWASSEYQPLPVLKKRKRRKNSDPSCMLKKKKRKPTIR